MKTYFTSDTHWNHKNILEYCNRPFRSVEHMGDMLIANWNEVVNPEDTVYHLGDFAMGDKGLIPGIFAKLNGNKILVRGNHDMRHNGVEMIKQVAEAAWVSIHEELYAVVDGVRLYMRHEPKMDFAPDPSAEFHLCGHVHNSWNRQGSIINVGVDVRNYRPATIRELMSDHEVIGKSHRGY